MFAKQMFAQLKTVERKQRQEEEEEQTHTHERMGKQIKQEHTRARIRTHTEAH